MPTQPSFPNLFHEYYAIHETIHLVLMNANGGPVDENTVEMLVREKHPELDMGPATLREAIKQAIKDTGAAE